LSGPQVAFNPRCALTLGWPSTELATNAAKYGALSTPTGRVDVAWEVDAEAQMLAIRWIESGGPAVVPPKHSGFGRLLLERVLGSDLRSTVVMDFAPAAFAAPSGSPSTSTSPVASDHDVAADKAAGRTGTADDSWPPRAGRAADAAARHLDGLRVLVVEDEYLVALLLEEDLRFSGCIIVGPHTDACRGHSGGLDRSLSTWRSWTSISNGEMVYRWPINWPSAAFRSCSSAATASVIFPSASAQRRACRSRTTALH
jgi:hypothetical protein